MSRQQVLINYVIFFFFSAYLFSPLSSRIDFELSIGGHARRGRIIPQRPDVSLSVGFESSSDNVLNGEISSENEKLKWTLWKRKRTSEEEEKKKTLRLHSYIQIVRQANPHGFPVAFVYPYESWIVHACSIVPIKNCVTQIQKWRRRRQSHFLAAKK
jgi:hypothetical protein